MKILHINKNDIRGGAAKIAFSLFAAQNSGGETASLLVDNKEIDSNKIYKIKKSRWRFLLSHLFGTDLDFFATDYLLQDELFKQADIVHVHNVHSHFFNLNTLAKMAKTKPIVWTLHDLWPVTAYCAHPLDYPLVDGVYRCPTGATRSFFKKYNQCYLMARKRNFFKNLNCNFVVPSQAMSEKLQGTVLADKKITLIHHGIDPAVFCPGDKTAARKKLNLPLDKKIVLFAAAYGANDFWKGWQFCQNILEKYKSDEAVIFVCLGGKNNHSTVNNLIVHDFVAEEKVLVDYYRAADAVLFPSLAESFGLVIIEAMACGTPVVSFPVGIAPEAINHQVSGYVAKYADEVDFSLGLNFIFGLNQAEKDKMAAAARLTIQENFTEELMCQNYLQLYQNILDAKI